jgi:hypothetical protein
MVLHLVAVLVLGLMCGSELNVAAFGHPVLNRQPLETHIRVRSSLTALFGRVMPFWMATSTALSLLLLLPFAHLTGMAWRWSAILPAYLRLARTFNVTLADLLTGKVSPGEFKSLNFEDVPHWRNLCARRHTRSNRAKSARQMDEALREVPAPSLNTIEKRTGYHKSTLQKHFPDHCRAVKKRFREFSAASIQERQAKRSWSSGRWLINSTNKAQSCL